jgi:hypothetical protein
MPKDTPLRFERRRYGSTTYTWVEAEIGGEWVSLGDPWPCITPKRSEIEAACADAWARRQGEALAARAIAAGGMGPPYADPA